jgi:hypothetical protein
MPKGQLLPDMEEFAGFMSDFFVRESRFGAPYDLIHANFFMSGTFRCPAREFVGRVERGITRRKLSAGGTRPARMSGARGRRTSCQVR